MIGAATVATALRDMLATSTHLAYGLGERPRDPATGRELPFPIGVLQLEPGTDWTGPPLADDHADVCLYWQLDMVGQTYEQVMLAVDRARTSIADRLKTGEYRYALAVPGLDVQIRELTDDSGIMPEAGLFQISQRFATHCFATGTPPSTGGLPYAGLLQCGLFYPQDGSTGPSVEFTPHTGQHDAGTFYPEAS